MLSKRRCAHGRQPTQCRDCGGSGVCEHGRRKDRCKECGGVAICAHGRQRHLCKECGGNSICAHGRLKNNCTACGGTSVCAHGRRRSTCKECGGGSICVHSRRRHTCKECRHAAATAATGRIMEGLAFEMADEIAAATTAGAFSMASCGVEEDALFDWALGPLLHSLGSSPGRAQWPSVCENAALPQGHKRKRELLLDDEW